MIILHKEERVNGEKGYYYFRTERLNWDLERGNYKDLPWISEKDLFKKVKNRRYSSSCVYSWDTVYGARIVNNKKLDVSCFKDMNAVVDAYNARFLALGKQPPWEFAIDTQTQPSTVDGLTVACFSVIRYVGDISGDIIMPDFVESIGCGSMPVFAGNPIKSIKLSKNLRVIGRNAFRGAVFDCDVEIPASVAFIEYGALDATFNGKLVLNCNIAATIGGTNNIVAKEIVCNGKDNVNKYIVAGANKVKWGNYSRKIAPHQFRKCSFKKVVISDRITEFSLDSFRWADVETLVICGSPDVTMSYDEYRGGYKTRGITALYDFFTGGDGDGSSESFGDIYILGHIGKDILRANKGSLLWILIYWALSVCDRKIWVWREFLPDAAAIEKFLDDSYGHIFEAGMDGVASSFCYLDDIPNVDKFIEDLKADADFS